MIILKALAVAVVLWALMVGMLIRSGRLQLEVRCRRCGYTPTGFRDAVDHTKKCGESR